ncbi:transposase (fragment) [Candidatus Methylobacter favarea]|uniref:Transposase n=1 Tax=Candidatus Methylobacter favarea TaxID=2707345 RepID=A0A8S0W8T1_9GAMM
MTKWCLTGGQTPDVTPAIGLVDGILAGAPGADKAWEAESVLENLEESQAKAVISWKSNRQQQREFDRHPYKNRSWDERFFCRVKQFRRPAARYAKPASRYSAFIA